MRSTIRTMPGDYARMRKTDQRKVRAPVWTPPDNATERRDALHGLLLKWYAREGRASLPWRHTRDPYAILVSEVMLQQTQVERVIPKYHAFLAQFPTLQSLAEATTADVIRAWAGLGYNMRAVRLQEIARQVMRDYDGKLPASLDGLLTLKGVGRYTAGAVACFAFGQPVATVDTNIRRTLWRMLRGVEPVVWPSGEAASRETLAQAEWALPLDRAYDWQQALMDLGATLCMARQPVCERCPLTAACAAWAEVSAVTLFPSGEALTRLRDTRATEASQAPSVAEVAAQYHAADPDAPPARPRRSRRSAGQPFTSTARYFRGRIVHALRELEEGDALSLADLGPRVKVGFTDADTPWLQELALGLIRDGLARSVSNGTTDHEMRIALP